MIGNSFKVYPWCIAVVIPEQGDIYLGVALYWNASRMTNFVPLKETAFARHPCLSIKEENKADGYLVEWAANDDLRRLYFFLIVLTTRAESIRLAR